MEWKAPPSATAAKTSQILRYSVVFRLPSAWGWESLARDGTSLDAKSLCPLPGRGVFSLCSGFGGGGETGQGGARLGAVLRRLY